MKKSFYGSLCYQGLRGGAIFIDGGNVIYKNQTLTLPEAYKNITIPIKQIKDVKGGHILFFPTVTIYLENQKYKFVIFNRKKFLETLGRLMEI